MLPYTTFITAVTKLGYLFPRPVFALIWFLIYIKLLLFWAWLWQLKEYHWPRFKAHFETQKLRKLIPSFWWLKYPKFTKKIIAILFTNTLLGIIILFSIFSFPIQKFYFSLFASIVLAPLLFFLVFLLFQIPTSVWQDRLLKRAQKKRQELKDLVVIGITGSYGKTSTKEFLAFILSKRFKVLKTKEHVNAEVGIAKAILEELGPAHQVFIAEIGAYEQGKIKQVSQMLQPKIGILTGINEQHMATFGSQENIIRAKFELIQSLPENGLAVLNEGDPKIKNEKLKIKNYNSKLKNIKYYSTAEKTDLWAEDIEVGKESISFKIFSEDGKSADFKINLVGGQNVVNILGACYVAKELGMGLSEIARACEKIKPPEKTMQMKKGRGGVTIIDDTYSANPAGVMAALDYLQLYSGQKIIIMPCLIELGKASKRVHQRIGERIGRVCDLAIITTRDRFKEMKQGAIDAGMKAENILFLENPKEIFEQLEPHLKEDNVILLESRVPNQLISLLVK